MGLKRIKKSIRTKLLRYGKRGERLGFYGEFGFFLVNWLPYLYFIKKSGHFLKTVGPVGSSPFYYFSDDHLELDCPYPVTCLGSSECNDYIQKRIAEILLSPMGSYCPGLSYEGLAFQSNKIHSVNPDLNYIAPSILSSADRPLFDELNGQDYVVISNKGFINWGTDFGNYFNLEEIDKLIDLITGAGFKVVFNYYGDNDGQDVVAKLAATQVKTDVSLGLFNAQDRYSIDKSKRNQEQIYLLMHSKLIISAQGGGSYLASMFGRPNYIIQRAGDDYNNISLLANLYGSRVKMFYYIDSLVDAVRDCLLK